MRLFDQKGKLLFIHNMTEDNFELTHKYRVKTESFENLLKIMDLHLEYYDKGSREIIENHSKTMWICGKNAEKDRTYIGMLVATSRKKQDSSCKIRSELLFNETTRKFSDC